MDHLDNRLATDGDSGTAPRRPSLQLELRAPDRRTLAAFREAFLRWLNDGSGSFTRVVGSAESLSLDESPPGREADGLPALRLTVTWAAAPKTSSVPASATSQQVMRRAAVSLPSRPRPPVVEHFVFFPDPPDTGVPLYRGLPVPFDAAGFEPRPGPPPPRVDTPIGGAMARRMVGVVRAMPALGSAASRRFGTTLRFPALAGYARARTAGLVGAIAVVGFAGWAVSLGTMPRPVLEPATTAAVSMAAPMAPAAPIGDVARLERPATPMAPTARTLSRDAPIVASASLGLPDTEVAAPRRRGVAPRSGLVRRPDIVVVRAVDAAATAATLTAERRRVKGALLVKSDPQGAEVSINGVVHGRTPLVIQDIGAGSRVVRLDLPGYERWSWSVAVVANTRTPVTAKLQPMSGGPGIPH